MKDWLRKRDTKGAYVNILQELRLNDHENFRKYLHHENFRKYLRLNTETYQVRLFAF